MQGEGRKKQDRRRSTLNSQSNFSFLFTFFLFFSLDFLEAILVGSVPSVPHSPLRGFDLDSHHGLRQPCVQLTLTSIMSFNAIPSGSWDGIHTQPDTCSISIHTNITKPELRPLSSRPHPFIRHNVPPSSLLHRGQCPCLLSFFYLV